MDLEAAEKLLNADMPARAVKTRKGRGGPGAAELSYVDGFYVFDRMNEILGPLGWTYTVRRLEVCTSGTDDKNRATVTYLAEVELWVGDATGRISDVGFGHGQDRDAGQAHEKAGKEAVTDAVKRCCRKLGRSMGLALYDKDQEFVSDGPEPEPENAQQAAGDAAAGPVEGAKKPATRAPKKSAAMAAQAKLLAAIAAATDAEQLALLRTGAQAAQAQLEEYELFGSVVRAWKAKAAEVAPEILAERGA
jgi:hypothetical protein